MADLICRKTMMSCQTPGMCSPFGGCQSSAEEAIDRMRAAVAAEQRRAAVLEKNCADLAAELERVRADAERYRGVRRVANVQGYTDERFDEQTDSRIAHFEAAMGKGGQADG